MGEICYTADMFKFWKKNKDDVLKVAEERLEKNRAIIESLRDYDTGKKDIQTTDIEKRLPDIRVAS